MSTQSDLAELYTAFFNRAPDSAGLAYWVNQLSAGTITLGQIAKNWVESQPEGQAKYPAGMSTTDFVNAIYDNVLSRVSDTAGLAYWRAQLDSGAISRDTFVATVINGAKSNTSTQGKADAALVANKATVGIAFADKGLNDVSLAAKVLTSVTADSNTLTATLDLLKLVPSAAAGQTTAVLAALNTALGNVANLIKTAPGELADLATYLNTVVSNISSGTNLATLFTSINTKVVAAQTNPSALDNPATQAGTDVTAATPTTGGGGDTTPPVTTPTFTVTNGTGLNAGTFTIGTLNGDVKVTLTLDGLLFTPTTGTAVAVKTVDITQGLVANGSVTVSADILALATLAHPVTGAGTIHLTASSTVTAANLISLDSLVTPKLDATALTGSLTGTQAQLLTVLSATTITGLAAKAVTISDSVSIAQVKAVDDKTTGAVTATQISDTAAHLDTNVGGYVKSGVTVTYTDTATVAQLTATQTLTGVTPIHGDVTDTIAHLLAGLNTVPPLVEGFVVQDSLANVLAENNNPTLPTGFSYTLTDGNLTVPADQVLTVAEGQGALSFLQAIVDHATNHASITLNAVFSLEDTVAHLTAAQADPLSVLTGRTYSINDSLENFLAAKADITSTLDLTHYSLTDAIVDLGVDLGVADAATAQTHAQAVVDGASNVPPLTLDATFTVTDSIANLILDTASTNPVTAGHDYSITDSIDNLIAYIDGPTQALTPSAILLSDSTVHLGPDITVADANTGAAHAQTIYNLADASPAALVVDYSLKDTVAALLGGAALLADHAFTVSDSLENVQAYLAGDTTVLTSHFAYSLTDANISVAEPVGVADALTILGGYTDLVNGAVNPADVTLKVTFNLVDSADNLANGTYASVVAGQQVQIDDEFISFAQLTAVKTAVGTGTGAGVAYNGIEDTIANLLKPENAGLIEDRDVLVSDAVSLAQVSSLYDDVGAENVTYTAVTDTAAQLSGNLGAIGGKTVVVSDAASVAQLTSIFGTAPATTYSAISDTAAHLVSGSTANAYILSGTAVSITGVVSIAQLTVIDTANGAGTLTYTNVSDTAANLSTHLVQITGKNVQVSDAVTIAQLTLITGVAPAALYGAVVDTAAELSTHLAQITAKVVAVTDAASISQLKLILSVSGAAYSAVTDSAASLAANPSLISGKAVVVNDAATIAQLVTIKSAAPSATYTALTGTAAELVSGGNANAYITNAVAVTVTGAISLSDLSAIYTANGVSTGVTYSAVTDTAAHLAAANGAILTGKTVVISDAVSIAQLATIKSFEPIVTYTAVTDNAAQLSAHVTDLAGKTVVVSDSASTAQLTLILGAASGATYTSVTDTAALLASHASQITAKTVVITGATSIDQLTAIKLVATSASYTAVTDTVAQLSGNLADLSGKVVVVSDAATIAQLGQIIGAAPGATYTAISDSAANLVSSGTASSYILNGTAVTVTGAISIADLNTVDAANGPTTVSYTAVTDTAAQLSTHTSQITGKTVVVSGVTDTTQLTAILTAAPDAIYTAVTDTAFNLAAHSTQITGKTVVVSDAASIAQLNTILAAQSNATYTAVTDTAANLATHTLVITNKTVVISDATSISQLTSIQDAAPSATYTAVTDTAAQLSTHLPAISGKTVVVSDAATIAQLSSILGTAPTATYTAITGAASDLVTSGTANSYIHTGVALTVTGAISIADLATIDLANGPAAVTYTAVTDTAAQLSTHTAQITGKTVIVSDAASTAQLTSILTAAPGATYTAVTDQAYELSVHLTQITGKTVVVSGATSIAELALIQGVVPGATYTAVTDSAAALSTHVAQITGKVVVVLDPVSIAQLALIQGAASETQYTNVNDTAATLAAHAGQITDKAVVVTDAATITQLDAIFDDAGSVVYSAVTGTAAELVANSAQYVKEAINVTITGTVSLGDVATIDGYTIGKVTVIQISDIASALVVAGVASKYIGEGSVVTVTDAVTIAQLKAIDLANGTTGSIVYTNITDTIENLTATGASAYYGLGINVQVTDAVAIAQLKALDLVNGTVTYTVDLNETAAALTADAISNAGLGTFTAGRNVTVSDDVTLSQLGTIDAAAATVHYSKVQDTVLALTADAVAGVGARIAAASVTQVTVTDAASIAQLKAIDDAATATLVYTQIADTADHLISNVGGYVSGSVTVTVSDTGTLTAGQLASIDLLTTTTVNATAVTGVTGNLAAVDSALKAAGLHLSGAESVSISDSAANLAGETLALTSTSTHDELHVDLTSTSTNLKGLTGFEDIYLAGSGRLTQVISIGDGDNVTVHAAAMSNVVLGSGHQSFISSAGNDTVALSSGSTFVFADSALTNGTDALNNFVTGSANSTLDFKAFLGNSYATGSQIVSSVSEFGGAAGTVTLVKGDDVAVGGSFGLASANTISVADFTSGYLTSVSGKEVLITVDNTAHTANVYFVNSAGGGNATTVDSASDIVKVGTITLTGIITDVGDLHTTAAMPA